MEFGELIRNERLKRDLDQMELGKLAGVSNMSIHRLENGGNVTIKTLSAILGVFDMKLEVVENGTIKTV